MLENNLEEKIKEKELIIGIEEIKEIKEFEKKWNYQCILLIIRIIWYALRLVIYIPSTQRTKEKLFIYKISEHWTLNETQEKSKEIEKYLKKEDSLHNLIVSKNIIPSSWFWKNLSNEIHYKKSEIFECIDLNDFIKPLDIVFRKGNSSSSNFPFIYHVGIYLGKIDKENFFCHIYSDDPKIIEEYEKNLNPSSNFFTSEQQKTIESIIEEPILSLVKRKINNYSERQMSFSRQIIPSSSSNNSNFKNNDMWARIDDQKTFLSNSKSIICYNTAIFLKDKKTIVRHLKNTLSNNYGKGEYDFLNKNCEHFANLVVHGLNHCSQNHSPLYFNKVINNSFFDNLEKKRELEKNEKRIFQVLEENFF